MEGDGLRRCTPCGRVMKRQTCLTDSPDVITLSVCRVANDGSGTVLRTPVVPADIIGITTRDGSKIKYKLGSIICHAGTKATSGHYWAQLYYGTDIIDANDTRINVIEPASAEKVGEENGCIYFYVKCNDAPINSCITVDDNMETIGFDSVQSRPLHSNDVDVVPGFMH